MSSDKLRIWLHALRAPFLTASGIPVLIGAFAAYWKTGTLSPARLGLALGGVLCLHLGANLANDYFDEITGCDRLNPHPTPFSGGSRVIQDGLLSARTIILSSTVFFALGLVQGLWLNHIVPGNLVLVLGLLGLVCGLLYSAVPFKLSYRGIGEVVVFFAFGPLVVAGSYLVQTGELAVFPFVAALPAGLLVLAVLLINEVLDVEWDGRAGKRTLVVILGERSGYNLYLAAYIGAYVWIAVGLLKGIYPLLACLAFVPLAVFIRHLLPHRALADRQATIHASRLTILSHTIVGTLLLFSYLIHG
jgi:1,4-dihydroxy-2-naphthoate octaprenyltransferase